MLPPHNTQSMEEEGRKVSVSQLEELGPGVEFYPVDSLNRADSMVYLAFEDTDDSSYLGNSWDRKQGKKTCQEGGEDDLRV